MSNQAPPTPERPHGVMFHHFHGGRHPEVQGSVDAGTLTSIIERVGPERFLQPSDWLDRLESDRLSPGDVCLTFDDNLLSQFDVALPVLRRFGLRAFWFVYSGIYEGHLERLEIYRAFRTQHFRDVDVFYRAFLDRVRDVVPEAVITEVATEDAIQQVLDRHPFYSRSDVVFRLVRDGVLGRDLYETVMDGMIDDHGLGIEELAEGLWMSEEHLRQLARDGHEIGLHSYSHPTNMAELPIAEQRAEYEANLRHLRTLGVHPSAAAHPANSYSADTLRVLHELEIRCGFTSHMGDGEERSRGIRALELPREDHANLLTRVGGS